MPFFNMVNIDAAYILLKLFYSFSVFGWLFIVIGVFITHIYFPFNVINDEKRRSNIKHFEKCK